MFKVLLSGKQREHACGVSANALLELGHDFTGICRVLNSSGIDGTISTHRFGEFNHSLAERFNLSTKIGQVLLSGKELYNTKSVSILNQTLLELGHNLSCVGGISNCVGVNGAIGTYRLGKLYNCLSELLKLLSECSHVLNTLEHGKYTALALHHRLHLSKSLTGICGSGNGASVEITSGKSHGEGRYGNSKFLKIDSEVIHRTSAENMGNAFEEVSGSNHHKHLNKSLNSAKSFWSHNFHAQNKRLKIKPELTNIRTYLRKSTHCSGSHSTKETTDKTPKSLTDSFHNRDSTVNGIRKSEIHPIIQCSDSGEEYSQRSNNTK